MKIKRAILISVALYFATLVVGILLTLLAIYTLSSLSTSPTFYWVITIITTVLLTSLACFWYFNKAQRTTKEGFFLGLTFVVVAFVLDIISFLLFSGGNALLLIKQYYGNISFYVVMLLVIATSVFVGSNTLFSSKNNKSSKK
jgi:hypothetical protein